MFARITPRTLPVVMVLLFTAGTGADETAAQPVPLTRAFAHNDYEHDRPLFDALDHGFCAVEADIFLIDGELLVAHDIEDCRPGRTLQALYLDPLLERVERYGGVYPGGPPFTLLIDIKNTGPETLQALLEALEPYRAMLTEFTGTEVKPGPVTAIVSGWFPRDVLTRTTPRLAASDGRMPHLGQSPHDYPLVSERWASVFDWNGVGEMPAGERAKLDRILREAHAAGQRVRFWALPPRGRAWNELYEAGLDLINTDHLTELQAFLLEKRAQEEGE